MVLLDVKRCKLPLPLEQLLPLLACFLAGKTLILIDFLAASQNYKAANWSSKFWAASAVPQIPVKYLIRSTLLEDTLSIVPSSSTAVSCCQEGLEKGTPQIFVKMMWLYIRCICIGWLRSLWTVPCVQESLGDGPGLDGEHWAIWKMSRQSVSASPLPSFGGEGELPALCDITIQVLQSTCQAPPAERGEMRSWCFKYKISRRNIFWGGKISIFLSTLQKQASPVFPSVVSYC